MKYLILSLIFMPWTAATLAQKADTVDKPPVKASEQQATKKYSSMFEIRMEESDGLVKFIRGDQLVLSRSASSENLYYVRGPGGLYASVVLNNPSSPEIGIEEHLAKANVLIDRIDGDTLKLTVIAFEPEFIDAYRLTPSSITPVSAQEYDAMLGYWKAAKKFNKAYAEALTDELKGMMPKKEQ